MFCSATQTATRGYLAFFLVDPEHPETLCRESCDLRSFYVRLVQRMFAPYGHLPIELAQYICDVGQLGMSEEQCTANIEHFQAIRAKFRHSQALSVERFAGRQPPPDGYLAMDGGIYTPCNFLS